MQRGATVTYYAGTQRIASRADGTLSYLLTDHLGSSSVTLNTLAAIVAEERYYPFGELRDDSWSLDTNFGYTGQRRLEGTGLLDYNARMYLPGVGRFISADTVLSELYSPQSLNRYSYVLNNPLKFTDPTGHCAEPLTFVLCGAGIGAAVGAGIYLATTVATGREFSWGDLAVSAAIGAVGGGLIATGVGMAGGITAFSTLTASAAAGGAVTGTKLVALSLTSAGTMVMASQASYSVTHGRNYNSKTMAVNAIGDGMHAGATAYLTLSIPNSPLAPVWAQRPIYTTIMAGALSPMKHLWLVAHAEAEIEDIGWTAGGDVAEGALGNSGIGKIEFDDPILQMGGDIGRETAIKTIAGTVSSSMQNSFSTNNTNSAPKKPSGGGRRHYFY